MSVENTQYLSQLSLEEIKNVHRDWKKSQITTLIGFGAVMGSLLSSGLLSGVASKHPVHPEAFLGSITVSIGIVILMLIISFYFLNKARRTLRGYATQKSMLYPVLLKEYKGNVNAKFIRELEKSASAV